ncbi:MAG: arylsulfatase [Sedimentisphaeraceae bacterium JB056]
MKDSLTISRRKFMGNFVLAAGAAGLGLSGFSCSVDKRFSGSETNKRPNILLVMSDDMGCSDIGCYGGEINTPNINRLAEEGVRFKKFYNTGRCCPSRASLLTGQYSHRVGMGWMTGADLGTESYAGQLNKKGITIAEGLKLNNYETYMCGKWHLSLDKNISPDGDKSSWPCQRGFDHYYGHLGGGYGYYTRDDLLRDNKFVPTGDDFYLTNNVTAEAVNYLESHLAEKTGKPFFMYLAYYAPHRPLHVPAQYSEKYEGKYLKGWDRIRQERIKRQKEMGLIDDDVKLSERGPVDSDEMIPAWESVPQEQRKLWDKRMATYAGQIECMDEGLGKVIDTLRDAGELDNTLVIFVSDNGACAEIRGDGNIDTIGGPETVESYRPNWANVSNTPYRLYKHYVHEGGVMTPLIVRWPSVVKGQGGFCEQIGHFIDILPTCLDAAGVEYPESFDGNKINMPNGVSLLPALQGRKLPQRNLYWEHEANRGIRSGDWKLVSVSVRQEPYLRPWELYNLKDDPTEMNDLAAVLPEKKKKLEAMWEKWAIENEVYPLDGSGWSERMAKGK